MIDKAAGRVIIQLHGRVTEGRWEDLVSFLREAIPFYELPGGIQVKLLRDIEDPQRFVEVVEYDSEEAYQHDQLRVAGDPAMIARLQEWRNLLTGQVEVRTFHDVTPKPSS